MLRKAELQRLLNYVSHSRHPERDRVMVLLSFRAGLRAKEIAQLTWSMVTDTTGELADAPYHFITKRQRAGLADERSHFIVSSRMRCWR